MLRFLLFFILGIIQQINGIPLTPEQQEIHSIITEHVLNQANIPISYHLENPIIPFIGRVSELSEIKWTHIDKKMVVITGLRGVGKSELAKKYAQEFRSDNQSSIIWINAESHISFRDDFKDLGINVGLKLENKDVTTIITTVFEYFKNRKTLFIFDNSADDNLFVNNLPSWIGKSKLINVIVTSRSENWDKSKFQQIKLLPFTKDEAKEFVKTAIHKEISMVISDESVDQLSEILKCIPLALNHAVQDIIKKNLLNPSKIYTIDDFIKSYQETPVVQTITEVRGPTQEELEDAVSAKIKEEVHRVGDQITNEAKRFGHRVENEGRRVRDKVKKWFG